MSKKFYITTAIPYVNATPHIGFALELVQTDVLARYHRQKNDNVFFLTGTDDNSLKNVQAAVKAGLSTARFCDQNAAIFKSLKEVLNVSFDEFIRTTEERHFKGAQKLWSACKPEDLDKKKYKGFYCVGCEAFYLEKDLADGKCPEHKTVPEVVEEENYFFKLSNYQTKLLELIESDIYKITPVSRKNEIVNFIKMGLEDFSISRSVDRAHGWGVPVPGDDGQIMYVWFDALANYLNGLDYATEGEKFKTYWPADVHVVGKGITRFHAIYWPAILLSAGLPLPKELFVHGYINVRGEKMSKSLGNVINPIELVNKYGTDAVRYYLLKYIHPFEDSDFSIESFEEVYNADLANGIGNLVSRTANMVEKSLDGVINKIIKGENVLTEVNQEVNDYQFNSALQLINLHVSQLDALIDKEKPWELAKTDTVKAGEVLTQVVAQIIIIAENLKPFLPETAEKIEKIFTASKIKKPAEPLFKRIV